MAAESDDKILSPLTCSEIENRWVKLGFLIIAIFYIITVAAKWWPTPDSSLYLGLGKSMISGHGYNFNGETSNCVTPGMPAILAGIMAVFGENYWVLNLFSALCAVVALGMAYMVIRNITNSRRLAFAVMLCTAMSYDYYRVSRMILTDMTFCAIFWCLMFCVLKFRDRNWLWLLLSLFLAAIALTVRIPGVFIFLPLAAGLLICWPGGQAGRRGVARRWAISTGLAVISVGMTGMFYFIAKSISTQKPAYANAMAGEGLGGVTMAFMGKFFEGMCELPKTASDMIISQNWMITGLLVLMLAITGCVVAWRKSLGFLVIFWWLTVCAFAVINGAIAVRSRYLLAPMPVLFLFVIWGIMWWCQKISAWAGKPCLDAKKLTVVVTIFVIVIGGFNLPRVLKIGVTDTFRSYSDEYYKYLRKGEFADLMQVSAMLGRTDINSSIYAADISRIHYLSGRVVTHLPSHDIKTDAEVNAIIEFAAAPATQGYLVIDMKEPRAKDVTQKLDADENLQKVFTGKFLKVYEK